MTETHVRTVQTRVHEYLNKVSDILNDVDYCKNPISLRDIEVVMVNDIQKKLTG